MKNKKYCLRGIFIRKHIFLDSLQYAMDYNDSIDWN